MPDPTTNLTDEERQRLLTSTSQPIIPSLHSIPPLPATQQANLMSGTKVAPQVGKEMFAAGMPSVSAAPGTADYGAQRQEKQDYEKMHPWGSPVSAQPGTWGKIGHVASRIGNIAGDILAPGITANIPGSDLNKQREAAQNAKWINLGGENELRQAQEQGIEQKPEIEAQKENAAESRAEAAEEGREKRLGETTAAQEKRTQESEAAREKIAQEGEAAREKMQGTALTAAEQRQERAIAAADARSERAQKNRPEPGSYVPVPDPTDPIHKIIGWVDPKSGHFRSLAEIPGMAANSQIKPTGAEASREGQAAVVSRAADGLIASINSHRDKLGNVNAIVQSAFLGTPLADPTQAELATEIASFAALNPAMHGFRGQDALREFEKIIGGIPKNPDALIASINGIKKTAGYFDPNAPAQATGRSGQGSITVQAGGRSFTFPDQAAADKFRQEAGIK